MPRAILALCALLLAACMGLMAGGGSEATNGNIVAGNLEYADGTPVSQARIWLRPAGYLKDTAEAGLVETAPDAIADKDGRFVVDSLPIDDYLLEAQDGKGKGIIRYVSARGTATRLSPDTLRPLGTLEGRLERLGNVPQSAYARLYGLERIAKADSAGNFAFPNLPGGQYRIEAVSSLPDHGFQTAAPVLIYPDSATRLETLPLIRSADENYSAWPFSRRLNLATDSIPQGETVRDFPLLVRLDAGNFDFGQSLGSDLRFSGPDGGHLAYEVERWDPQARQAEIWVRLDSLSGGNPVQMTMHWGRLQAPDFSFGPAVFATFGGVWHLQAKPGFYGEMLSMDASPGAAPLTGLVEAGDRSGAIGNGAGFRGPHALKATGHAALWPESSFVISAWIKIAGIQPAGAGILSLGDNYVLRVEPAGTVRFFYYNDTIVLSEPWAGPWVDAGTIYEIDDQGWHWVAANLDGDSLRICIDGVSRAAVRARGPVTYGRGSDLFIGLHGGTDSDFRFHGQIDEVRISGTSRSRAWIKLAYETQKPRSTALIFR
jgi:hypothetical protein